MPEPASRISSPANRRTFRRAVAQDLFEGMLLRAEGKPRAALEALEHWLSGEGELGITYLLVKLSFVEALEAASELGDTGKVEELLGRIEALRAGERPPLLTAHGARFRARLASDSAEADIGFRRAAEQFRELGMVFWLAVTQLEHAERLVQHGRSDEAEPLLAEAREVFERLDAAPWVARAAQASSSGLEAEAVSV